MDSRQQNKMNFWHQQHSDEPLYPDLIWSRPEQLAMAGKLLIIGGNSYSFNAPAQAFNDSQQSGIGEIRVLLPDSLRSKIGKSFSAGQFAPSTPSGSFSQKALAEFLDISNWADGILLAGDFGRNSETAIVLESLISTSKNHLTFTQDSIDFFMHTSQDLMQRPNTCLVISFNQLQKLTVNINSDLSFSSDMDLIRLVQELNKFTTTYELSLVTQHQNYIFVAAAGKVSSTKILTDSNIWPIKTASFMAVWRLQNKSRVFEALTTAAYILSQKN